MYIQSRQGMKNLSNRRDRGAKCPWVTVSTVDNERAENVDLSTSTGRWVLSTRCESGGWARRGRRAQGPGPQRATPPAGDASRPRNSRPGA